MLEELKLKIRYSIIDFIDLHFHTRYCWASLVCWAAYGGELRKPTKCGYCYNCFTEKEVEADREKRRF